jgi:F0F1-type ATP synthase assembly protein I
MHPSNDSKRIRLPMTASWRLFLAGAVTGGGTLAFCIMIGGWLPTGQIANVLGGLIVLLLGGLLIVLIRRHRTRRLAASTQTAVQSHQSICRCVAR